MEARRSRGGGLGGEILTETLLSREEERHMAVASQHRSVPLSRSGTGDRALRGPSHRQGGNDGDPSSQTDRLARVDRGG